MGRVILVLILAMAVEGSFINWAVKRLDDSRLNLPKRNHETDNDDCRQLYPVNKDYQAPQINMASLLAQHNQMPTNRNCRRPVKNRCAVMFKFIADNQRKIELHSLGDKIDEEQYENRCTLASCLRSKYIVLENVVASCYQPPIVKPNITSDNDRCRTGNYRVTLSMNLVNTEQIYNCTANIDVTAIDGDTVRTYWT